MQEAINTCKIKAVYLVQENKIRLLQGLLKTDGNAGGNKKSRVVPAIDGTTSPPHVNLIWATQSYTIFTIIVY